MILKCRAMSALIDLNCFSQPHLGSPHTQALQFGPRNPFKLRLRPSVLDWAVILLQVKNLTYITSALQAADTSLWMTSWNWTFEFSVRNLLAKTNTELYFIQFIYIFFVKIELNQSSKFWICWLVKEQKTKPPVHGLHRFWWTQLCKGSHQICTHQIE